MQEPCSTCEVAVILQAARAEEVDKLAGLGALGSSSRQPGLGQWACGSGAAVELVDRD